MFRLQSSALFTCWLISSTCAFTPDERLGARRHNFAARTTRLHAQNVGDTVKGGIKFLLVPNAKRDTPSSSSYTADDTPSISSDVTSAEFDPSISATTSATSIPDVIKDEVVPFTPYEPPAPVTASSASVSDIVNVPPIDPVTTVSEPISSVVPSVTAPPETATGSVDIPAWKTSLSDFMSSNFAKTAGQAQSADSLSTTTPPAFDGSAMRDMASSIRMPEMSFSLDNVFPVDKFSSSLNNLGDVLPSQTTTLPDVMNAMNMNELGGWYVGAFSLIVAGIASAAISPPEVSTPTGSSVSGLTPVDGQAGSKDDGTASLPGDMKSKVQELNSVIERLNMEITDLKADKSQTTYELATLKSDVRVLQNDLKEAYRRESELQESIKSAESKLHSETARYEKELEETYAKLGKPREVSME
jgi:FtsZ-binding cell division protein ZapB